MAVLTDTDMSGVHGPGYRPMFYAAVLRSLMSRYVGYAVQIVSLIVLARVFSPAEYGVVASIQVFYAFFQIFAEAGLASALISVSSISRKETDGIFLLTILLGVVLSTTFLLFGRFFQQFYGIPGVLKVVPFAAGAIFFYALSIVPTAALNREMRFMWLAQTTAFADVVSTVSAILIHSFFDPVRALASKMVIVGLIQFVFLYFFCTRTKVGRLGISKHFSALKQLRRFSIYQLSFSVVNYFSRNLDNIVVGRVMGPMALGVYDRAYQLMRYPLMLLTFAMTPAIQPAITKHSDNPSYVEMIHSDFVYKLAWLGVAVGAGISLTCPWIVLLLLGPRWLSTVPIIRALGLSISTQIILSTSGSFFQAMKRTDLLFVCGMCYASLLVVAIGIGISCHDLILMSWLISAVYTVSFFPTYFILYKYVFCMSPWIFFARLRTQMILNIMILVLGNPLALPYAKAIFS